MRIKTAVMDLNMRRFARAVAATSSPAAVHGDPIADKYSRELDQLSDQPRQETSNSDCLICGNPERLGAGAKYRLTTHAVQQAEEEVADGQSSQRAVATECCSSDCARIQPDGTNPMPLGEVEIDVFSGRPNPRWKLSHLEIIELQKRIRALRKPTASPSFPALGFRGFVIRLGILSAVVFAKRVIISFSKSQQSVFVDTEGIQELLSRQAARHGFSKLLQF